jgi:hypothetical protein
MITAQGPARDEATAGSRRRLGRGGVLAAVLVTVAAGAALTGAPAAHAFTAQADDLGVYTMSPAASNGAMVADIPNSSTSPGTGVQLWSGNDGENQKFHVVKVSPPSASQTDAIRVYSSSYTTGSVLASPVLIVSDQYMSGTAECAQTAPNPTVFYSVAMSPCNASGVDSPNELWYAVFVSAIDSWELVSGASVQTDGANYDLTGSALKSIANDYEPLVMAPLAPAAGRSGQGNPVIVLPADSSSGRWIGWNFGQADYTVDKTVTVPASSVIGSTVYYPCAAGWYTATDGDNSGDPTYHVSLPANVYPDKAAIWSAGVNPGSAGDTALGNESVNQLGLGESDSLSRDDFTITFVNYNIKVETGSLQYFCSASLAGVPFVVSDLDY